MTTPPPLQLLFRQPMDTVKELLQSTDASLLANSLDFGRVPSGEGKTFQNGSMGYELEWSETLPSFSGYKTVFFDPPLSEMLTILSFSLGPHLEGGNLAAPVAQAFLAFAAKLAAQLSADAIVCNSGHLISEPAFFIETVESYAAGGAFPVLVTVDFEYQDDESALRTTGLSWYSGQEIALSGAGLSGPDLARRAVRLIHDIAVNGPVLTPQFVSDLDGGLLIELTPPHGDDQVLNCHIQSKSDVSGKALTHY